MQYRREETPFGFPHELWTAKILHYFTLQELALLSLVSKSFYLITKHQHFWKLKYSHHFPLLYAKTDKKNNYEWGKLFKTNLLAEFPDKKLRTLFYTTKDGIVNAFKPEQIQDIQYFLLYSDSHKLSVVDWLNKLKYQALLDKLFALVEQRFDPTNENPKTWNLSHWAVACNQSRETIEHFLSNQNFNNWPRTPLHIAAFYNLPHHIPILLNAHININQPNRLFQDEAKEVETNKTALHIAVQKNHPLIVDVLCKSAYTDCVMTILPSKRSQVRGIGRRRREGLGGITPLHLLVKAEFESDLILKSLLDANASPLAVDSLGETPLSIAITMGRNGIVNNFIIHLKQTSIERLAIKPLHYALFEAVRCKRLQYISELLALGANPLECFNPYKDEVVPNDEYRSAFDLATDSLFDRRDDEMIKLLLQSNVDINKITYKVPYKWWKSLPWMGITLTIANVLITGWITHRTALNEHINNLFPKHSKLSHFGIFLLIEFLLLYLVADYVHKAIHDHNKLSLQKKSKLLLEQVVRSIEAKKVQREQIAPSEKVDPEEKIEKLFLNEPKLKLSETYSKIGLLRHQSRHDNDDTTDSSDLKVKSKPNF